MSHGKVGILFKGLFVFSNGSFNITFFEIGIGQVNPGPAESAVRYRGLLCTALIASSKFLLLKMDDTDVGVRLNTKGGPTLQCVLIVLDTGFEIALTKIHSPQIYKRLDHAGVEFNCLLEF